MSTLPKVKKYVIVGIDEAGRGPLAGPVSVGVVALRKGNLSKFKEVKDSKKINSLNRDFWFEKMCREKKLGNLDFTVGFSSNLEIDKYGISEAIRRAMGRALKKLELNPKKTKVFLDGLLSAPSEYVFQKTIIKGDEKIKIISLASIVAKVSRDRKMEKFSKMYPKYNFEKHKGYGTLEHLSKIKYFGTSPLHRKSFIKKF